MYVLVCPKKTLDTSLGTDGSNDKGLEKMNPTIIKIFEVKWSKCILTHFFNMCLTSGNECGTVKTLFTAIENKFDDSSLPWSNCVGLSIDSTNTVIGKHNAIASNTLKKNLDFHRWLSLFLSLYCSQSCLWFFF